MRISVQDLEKAIRLELEGVKRAIDSFDLTELGKQRVQLAIDRFEAATVADMELFQTLKYDVRESLQGRLENIRDLPRAIRGAMLDSKDAKWLGEWLIEAEGDPASGLASAFEANSQVSKTKLAN
jgi:hypothetical protein